MSDEQQSFIKTPQQLIKVVVLAFVVPIAIILLLVKFVGTGQRTGAGADAMTPEAIEARIQAGGRLRIARSGCASCARGAEGRRRRVGPEGDRRETGGGRCRPCCRGPCSRPGSASACRQRRGRRRQEGLRRDLHGVPRNRRGRRAQVRRQGGVGTARGHRPGCTAEELDQRHSRDAAARRQRRAVRRATARGARLHARRSQGAPSARAVSARGRAPAPALRRRPAAPRSGRARCCAG